MYATSLLTYWMFVTSTALYIIVSLANLRLS